MLKNRLIYEYQNIDNLVKNHTKGPNIIFPHPFRHM